MKTVLGNNVCAAMLICCFTSKMSWIKLAQLVGPVSQVHYAQESTWLALMTPSTCYQAVLKRLVN